MARSPEWGLIGSKCWNAGESDNSSGQEEDFAGQNGPTDEWRVGEGGKRAAIPNRGGRFWAFFYAMRGLPGGFDVKDGEVFHFRYLGSHGS